MARGDRDRRVVRPDQWVSELSERLCACGCGQRTFLSPKTNLAKGYVRGEPRRFVRGHGMRAPGAWRPPVAVPVGGRVVGLRGDGRQYESAIGPRRACGCGCGEPVARVSNLYLKGHWHRPEAPQYRRPVGPLPLCNCGCGKSVAAIGRRRLPGHRFKQLRWVAEDRGFGTPCWVWQLKLDVKGYGRLRVGERDRIAHRVVYEDLVGVIPEGHQLHHRCRVKECVNPEHLVPLDARAHGYVHGETHVLELLLRAA